MTKVRHNVKNVDKRWLTVSEAQAYLGFGTRNTQQEWRDSGQLPYCCIGRMIVYDVSDLDAFVQRHRINPNT